MTQRILNNSEKARVLTLLRTMQREDMIVHKTSDEIFAWVESKFSDYPEIGENGENYRGGMVNGTINLYLQSLG